MDQASIIDENTGGKSLKPSLWTGFLCLLRVCDTFCRPFENGLFSGSTTCFVAVVADDDIAAPVAVDILGYNCLLCCSCSSLLMFTFWDSIPALWLFLCAAAIYILGSALM